MLHMSNFLILHEQIDFYFLGIISLESRVSLWEQNYVCT